jgi:hypothetical protein
MEYNDGIMGKGRGYKQLKTISAKFVAMQK